MFSECKSETMEDVDNSDYMRNGDFLPTRLHAQQDAVNIICHSKTRANPENNVGLLSIANTTEVLVTLTTDVGKLLAKLHQVQPKGNISFVTAIRIAHLVLKHRQGKNHRMRIIVFVGSPIAEDDKEMVKLAKRLRKEKVNVDVINFGEELANTEKLTVFINTLNGTDGTSSHLVTVPSGPLLSDALITSPIIVGEDGTGVVPGGYEFGIDPNEDPELALALRVSMEEQRARQEDESRKATAASTEGMVVDNTIEETVEDQLLKQALEMSLQPTDMEVSSGAPSSRDVSALTEEEQMEIALRMSMQPSASHESMEAESEGGASSKGAEAKVDVPTEDISAELQDEDFLNSVLASLPGVNPEDPSIKEAVEQLTKQTPPTTSDDKSKKPSDAKKKGSGGGKKEKK